METNKGGKTYFDPLGARPTHRVKTAQTRRVVFLDLMLVIFTNANRKFPGGLRYINKTYLNISTPRLISVIPGWCPHQTEIK
jgi:hypothetical protein